MNAVASGYVGLLVHGYFNASIAAAELEGLRWDEAARRWAGGGSVIENGALVRFRVAKVHNADGVLSFEGEFLEAAAPTARV